MHIWKIEDDLVMRKGQVIAEIYREDGKVGWRGLGMHRENFKQDEGMMERILEDVKYFHRYNPPKLTLTFASGRKAVYR